LWRIDFRGLSHFFSSFKAGMSAVSMIHGRIRMPTSTRVLPWVLASASELRKFRVVYAVQCLRSYRIERWGVSEKNEYQSCAVGIMSSS